MLRASDTDGMMTSCVLKPQPTTHSGLALAPMPATTDHSHSVPCGNHTAAAAADAFEAILAN